MVGFCWPRLEQITTKDKVGNAIRTRRGVADLRVKEYRNLSKKVLVSMARVGKWALNTYIIGAKSPTR